MAWTDDINLQVHDSVGADVHADLCEVTPPTGTVLHIPVERLPETFESEFDTGSDERDFNLLKVLVSSTHLPAPLEKGRGTVGHKFVFDAEPGKTWWCRQIEQHGRAGGYHRLLLSDYEGPID